MNSFWRSFLAVLLGVIASFIIIMMLELVGHVIFPVPEGINLKVEIEFKSYVSQMSFMEFLPVLLAHFIGVFVGCISALKFGRGNKIPVYIVGCFVLVGSIVNVINIPHPVWFIVADIGLVILGLILVVKRKN